MNVLEGHRHLFHQPLEPDVNPASVVEDLGLQVGGRKQLHREEAMLLVRDHLVVLDDVGVVETRSDLEFVFQGRDLLGIFQRLGEEQLQGDAAGRLRVDHFPHLAVLAAGKAVDELVLTDRLTVVLVGV